MEPAWAEPSGRTANLLMAPARHTGAAMSPAAIQRAASSATTIATSPTRHSLALVADQPRKLGRGSAPDDQLPDDRRQVQGSRASRHACHDQRPCPARRSGAQVNVVHVATRESRSKGTFPNGTSRVGDVSGDIREEGEQLLVACPDARFIERRGDPASVLLEIADGRDAHMIIVGTASPHGWRMGLDIRHQQVSRDATRHPTRPALLRPRQTEPGSERR